MLGPAVYTTRLLGANIPSPTTLLCLAVSMVTLLSLGECLILFPDQCTVNLCALLGTKIWMYRSTTITGLPKTRGRLNEPTKLGSLPGWNTVPVGYTGKNCPSLKYQRAMFLKACRLQSSRLAGATIYPLSESTMYSLSDVIFLLKWRAEIESCEEQDYPDHPNQSE